VAQVYRDLLGREVDSFGLSVWGRALDSGAFNRIQVAFDITLSPEYQNRALDQLYAKFLRRAVDPLGRTAWDAFLTVGGTLEQVEANILASKEYFQAQGGSSNASWLPMVYRDVLGRNLDSQGQAAWGNALNMGASLLSVASGILDSVEAD